VTFVTPLDQQRPDQLLELLVLFSSLSSWDAHDEQSRHKYAVDTSHGRSQCSKTDDRDDNEIR
jgi:hypothetical protein